VFRRQRRRSTSSPTAETAIHVVATTRNPSREPISGSGSSRDNTVPTATVSNAAATNVGTSSP
jgi:hypothetical protein